MKLTEYQSRAVPALLKSIEHWKRMDAGTHGAGEGPTSECCACCEEFGLGASDCEECPVHLASEMYDCNGTPYTDADSAFSDRDRGVDYDHDAMGSMVTYLEDTLFLVRSGDVAPEDDS